MNMPHQQETIVMEYSLRDGVPTIVMENSLLRVEVAPAIGGRIASLVHLPSGREFLWRNPKLALRANTPGSEYDPNFYGGMDELLPNDIPENLDGVACPDHGELWTLPLKAEIHAGRLTLSGELPGAGIGYERRMRLAGGTLTCDYKISNRSEQARHFLWKLHASLAVSPGDIVRCDATTARPVDPSWTCCPANEPFAWPVSAGKNMSVIPELDGSGEFLYLYGLKTGRIALEALDSARIECAFDMKVFPCCWYFSSHGKMDGAFVGILEPCTNMPISVNDAARNGVCASLLPGETLETTVSWTASKEIMP